MFAKEVFIIAFGMTCGFVSSAAALMLHGAGLHLLSILYSVLMPTMYYLWFSITTLRDVLKFCLGCTLTGYLLGFLEASFLL